MANISSECQLSRDNLIDAWIEAYSGPPPKGLSTRLLRYAIHYNRQAKEYGGLRKSTLRQLGRYVPAPHKTSPAIETPTATAKPMPGTRLVREWRGRTHMVDVRSDGFLYEGKSFGSLSEVARTITGARWSGPRFFGL
ncbi:DUF2924 domain-containing protein [Sneathiella chungangensis]|uniref:DUF2924 domain-containing protein n=1 Tax=Sneathiella chungangensis TaxID=1418234 RepID=A0A845MH41_9PROT|nr:DUF2924 domain-containing protein [Sneathiella chungangensis]MZR22656.1 DUF2924 domain-containing protein [Sneathiella chungangensis]